MHDQDSGSTQRHVQDAINCTQTGENLLVLQRFLRSTFFKWQSCWTFTFFGVTAHLVLFSPIWPFLQASIMTDQSDFRAAKLHPSGKASFHMIWLLLNTSLLSLTGLALPGELSSWYSGLFCIFQKWQPRNTMSICAASSFWWRNFRIS